MAFLLFIALPLLEIIGFSTIGVKIGFGYSVLWLIVDVFLGIYCLQHQGRNTITKAHNSINNEIYPLKEVLDGIFIIIGSLLLIFPGFISDIFALILLTPPIRSVIFLILKAQNESVLEEFAKSGESFTHKYYEKDSQNHKSTTIEGDYIVIDDKDIK